jgi:hypothetical protein
MESGTPALAYAAARHAQQQSRVGAVGRSWREGCNLLLHHEILRSFGMVLDDPHHHAERENKQKLEA